MSDIFREVDEEVRRERLQQLWERHGNLIVALALLIVLAVGGWRGYDWWEDRKATESGAAFEAAVALAESGKQDEAQAAFSKLAKDGSSGYRVLARFREAAELAKTDPAAAVMAYESLAAESGVGRSLQDLAVIRAALILVDTATPAELAARLEPLTASTISSASATIRLPWRSHSCCSRSRRTSSSTSRKISDNSLVSDPD